MEKIKKLEERIKVLEKAYKKKNDKNGMLWGIVIILFVVLICTQIPYFQVDNNYVGLVLAFVGILATFVVISNYSQLKTMEDKHRAMDDRFEDVFEELEESNKNMTVSINDATVFTDVVLHISLGMSFVTLTNNNHAVLAFFNALEKSFLFKDNTVLQEKYQNSIIESIYLAIKNDLHNWSHSHESLKEFMSHIENSKYGDIDTKSKIVELIQTKILELEQADSRDKE